ncbi:hypothetical protein D7V97_10135 [Corallococcus sp. CA053C]|uniref:hypothetical protein n=1 Tax=Corallococcus sp. CA053C TaxID=2316732 RepID=UPI000EA2A71C|nr:hypothetical protein [Corallococcus sp. CA053C]RKH11804.1 hypothetical protein D7V97_10135 [Corallococcus sp. CA053C]
MGEAGPPGVPGPQGERGEPGPKGEPGSGAPGADLYLAAHIRVIPLGGTALESGALLRAAVEAVPSEGSQTWVLKLGAGTYDLGSTGLTLKTGVYLEGSNSRVSRLVSSTGGKGTVVGAAGAGLRNLYVGNTGGGDQSVALFNTGVGFAVSDVRVEALQGKQLTAGLIYQDGASNTVSRVTVWAASDTGTVVGTHIQGSTVTVEDSRSNAQGGPGVTETLGLSVVNGGANLFRMQLGANGRESSRAFGLDVKSGNVTLVDSEAFGGGATLTAAVHAGSMEVSVRSSRLLTGASLSSFSAAYALYVDSSSTWPFGRVGVDQSSLEGFTAGMYVKSGARVRLSHSFIRPAPKVEDGATAVCVFTATDTTPTDTTPLDAQCHTPPIP